MRDAFAMLQRFSPTDVSVTLLGETGVGKEALARTTHQLSARTREPFVVFDCGAVTATLAESELLGHERGSFTGAVGAHPGAFERAHGGTLFLDEIGELPIDLQPRLLRALETRQVRRVGGSRERRVDVRIIAATSRDLRADVKAGRFRQDLYFRLAVAVVHVPPLRQRVDDLPKLVRVLLAELGRADLLVSNGALGVLRRHEWPGNVRELKNVLTYTVALLDPGTCVVEPKHLAGPLAESASGGDLELEWKGLREHETGSHDAARADSAGSLLASELVGDPTSRLPRHYTQSLSPARPTLFV